MASQGTALALKRNNAWKPNGPAEYARSARKWGIKPTKLTTFFVHENVLMRRGVEHKAHHEHERKEHHHHKGTGAQGSGGDPTTGSGGATTTPPTTTPPSSTTGSEVPADDVQNDLEYVVPVKIGTPGVTLNLDFDTGSADLWVWSSLLKTTTANEQGHTIYNPTNSSTATQQNGLTWNISYGDGSSASGTVYKDTISLGDNLVVPNQEVEAATKLSSQFLTGDASSDGLLGLAFPSINTVSPTQAATPVENMISQNLIAQPLFTAKLDKGDSNGFYTFGYIDDTVLPAGNQITYADVDSSNGFWEFQSPALVLNGKSIARASGNTAIADTGTTLILLDDSSVEAIYKSIEGAKLDNTQGGYTIPSSATLPTTIGFSVAGTVYNIPGEDLLFSDAGNGTYFGSIQSRGQNPQDILGDVFLKRVYAVFDQTNGSPRIGFGQRSFT